MAEEKTLTEVKKESNSPKKAPILQFTGPEGAPKIVALMAALLTILTGNELFWEGRDKIQTNILFGSFYFYGVMLYILGGILILLLGILQFGKPRLKKIEEVGKYFRWEVLLIFFIFIFLFETLSIPLSPVRTRILSSILLLAAIILEFIRKRGNETKPSKFVAIIGMIFTLLDIGFLMSSITPDTVVQNYWDAIVGITVVILLLLSILNDIKFVPYQWWMVLILGFIIYGWVGENGGILILISFILMLLEK